MKLNFLFITVFIVFVKISFAQSVFPTKAMTDFNYWLAYSFDNNSNTQLFVYQLFDANSKGDVIETFKLLEKDRLTQNKILQKFGKLMGYSETNMEMNLQSIGMPTNSSKILTSYILEGVIKKEIEVREDTQMKETKKENQSNSYSNSNLVDVLLNKYLFEIQDYNKLEIGNTDPNKTTLNNYIKKKYPNSTINWDIMERSINKGILSISLDVSSISTKTSFAPVYITFELNKISNKFKFQSISEITGEGE